MSVTVYEIVKQSDKNLTNAQLPSLCNDQERLLLSLSPSRASHLSYESQRCAMPFPLSAAACRASAAPLSHSAVSPCIPLPAITTVAHYSPASIFATVTVLALLQVVATSVSLPAKTPRLFTPASALESALVGVSIFF